MDYEDLILDIQKIPFEGSNRKDNLNLLLKLAEGLKAKNDISDGSTNYLVAHASEYIRMQVNRLQIHIEAEIDIIAWISRGLMELLFFLRYVYNSHDRLDELIEEYHKDFKDIVKIMSKKILDSETPEEILAFNNAMDKEWEKIGVNPDELKGLYPVNYFAEKGNLEEEYQSNWKFHSKYVHPTSYLLFGDRNIVDGSDFRQYFWQHAQYYAGRNIRDLNKLIEASDKL